MSGDVISNPAEEPEVPDENVTDPLEEDDKEETEDE